MLLLAWSVPKISLDPGSNPAELMSTSTLNITFADFFRQATSPSLGEKGLAPYPYRITFAEADTLPELHNVPTGVGKTAAAILGWLYRRSYVDHANKTSTPHRLEYCLPMRVLVEQTEQVAQTMAEKMPADKRSDPASVNPSRWLLVEHRMHCHPLVLIL